MWKDLSMHHLYPRHVLFSAMKMLLYIWHVSTLHVS
ncbi:hypothetical protein C5167_041785 [Papaver somniferum]|nr:hypothetical protein C5167_041785 [Papaver somniferum]